ncbi:hypothetical protein YC2023_073828 [Brassica napus]
MALHLQSALSVMLRKLYSTSSSIVNLRDRSGRWHHSQELSTPSRRKTSNGAWKPGILAAGTAWSFYTNNGGMITSHSKLISYVNSSLVAERLALREAMEHALSLGLNRVNFKSDSKNLVAAIVDGACFSEIHGIASDITLLSNAFDFFSLRYCNRLSLSFEDGLAKPMLDSVCTRL